MFNLSNFFKAATSSGIPDNVVGVDFGSSSIKVVELELRTEALALRTYGELQLGPYADKDLGTSVKLDERKKTQALQDVMKEAGVSSKTGVLALPLSTSFVTIMSLTAKEDEDISPRVRVEARKYIPIPLTEVTLDWSELEALGNAPKSVREVVVAAVQNDAYGEMTNVMQSINKLAQPSEIELFSAMRALAKQGDTSVAILDLGADTSKMYITHDGVLRKIHRAKIGGAQATARIAELTDSTFETAENLKRNYGPSSVHAQDVKRAVISTFERPLQEFRRVLAQHEMKIGSKVDRVVVTGGSASFPELCPFASYMFDRQVEQANPFSKVAFPAFMEDRLIEIGPAFSVALGAALRPFENG